VTTTNAAVRAEVARVLVENVGGVNVYDYPPDTIQAPAVILGGIDWVGDTMPGANRVVTMPLYVAVSRRNTNYLADLDELCDQGGALVGSFGDAPTATGMDSWQVTSVGSYRDINIGDTDYYAATVTLEVFC
jgi:hypothetical protein